MHACTCTCTCMYVCTLYYVNMYVCTHACMHVCVRGWCARHVTSRVWWWQQAMINTICLQTSYQFECNGCKSGSPPFRHTSIGSMSRRAEPTTPPSVSQAVRQSPLQISGECGRQAWPPRLRSSCCRAAHTSGVASDSEGRSRSVEIRASSPPLAG